ncbi:uncharacterized protein EI90DRAFT_3020585 [Cantharellus anzutake]|uniref:uncharacterized protein n=1 Tax=Cantharellus anzutake TaxID=1750568 RepID=UPI0019089EF7|nr:uncharacterized protein EI90DRAFT_3020585 [Cantharellus anzutake]KAF8320172.1 hypothetical protein EI90DRAFT_3020585 [Cantharellus anzutake]
MIPEYPVYRLALFNRETAPKTSRYNIREQEIRGRYKTMPGGGEKARWEDIFTLWLGRWLGRIQSSRQCISILARLVIHRLLSEFTLYRRICAPLTRPCPKTVAALGYKVCRTPEYTRTFAEECNDARCRRRHFVAKEIPVNVDASTNKCSYEAERLGEDGPDELTIWGLNVAEKLGNQAHLIRNATQKTEIRSHRLPCDEWMEIGPTLRQAQAQGATAPDVTKHRQNTPMASRTKQLQKMGGGTPTFRDTFAAENTPLSYMRLHVSNIRLGPVYRWAAPPSRTKPPLRPVTATRSNIGVKAA